MSSLVKLDGTIKSVFGIKRENRVLFPLFGTKVHAGFPSPAQDYIEDYLDLNDYLISHPAATFFIRVEGYSMINAGIYPNDILIVDRSMEAVNNKIIIAILEGELTVKRLKIDKHGVYYLMPENSDFQSIRIQPYMDFSVWGVVTTVIHQV